MVEFRFRPQVFEDIKKKPDIIESAHPEELQTPETKSENEQLVQTIAEGQSRWKRFVQSLRELPRTMKDLVGAGGMEGFRRPGVRGVYTAVRLALLLGSAGEAFKSMARAEDAQASDMDRIVQLSSSIEGFGTIEEVPESDLTRLGAPKKEEQQQEEDFHIETALTDIIIPLQSHESASEAQKAFMLSKERLQQNQDTLHRWQSGGDIKFFVREFDNELKDIDDTSEFFLDPDGVKKFSENPQVLNGSLESVVIHVDPDQLSKEDRSKFDFFTSVATHQFRDPYGNLVRQHGDGSFIIYIPYPFKQWEQQVSSHTIAPEEVRMDFSQIGLGTFEGALYSQPPQYVSNVGDGVYHIWSSADLRTDGTPEGDRRQSSVMEAAEGYATGVANMERFFGLDAGTIVKRFHVVPVLDENAMAMRASRAAETIVITTADTYQDYRKFDPEIGGQHEAAHMIGSAFGDIDANDTWKAFHEFSMNEANQHMLGMESKEDVERSLDEVERAHGKKSRERLEGQSREAHDEETINERDVYQNITILGGHAFDNSEELFASLINSLVDPEWEQKMLSVERSEQFIRWNLQAMETLRGMFTKEEKIPSDAPIFHTLDQRIVFLQQMLGEIK